MQSLNAQRVWNWPERRWLCTVTLFLLVGMALVTATSPQLTASEAVGVAVADGHRNFADCWNGWPSCKLSKLSPDELSDVEMARHRRNVTEWWVGWASCDRSKLTRAEVNTVIVSDHQRNYMACVRGFAECDASQLTPAEIQAVTTGKITTSR